MYDTKIAAKLLAQLNGFLGRISPHFRKPVARFIGDMMYGIMAEKDVKLSSIVRALKEGITPKKVEDRLSRMLSSKGVEDTIRHVKQSYRLEDIRLFKYGKLKAMAAVVLATVYFSMVWIGNSEKHAVIARSIARMSFRIHGVPDFHFYSIADGASEILKGHGGRWRGFDQSEAERKREASLFEFFGLNTG